MNNIFAALPDNLDAEVFEDIVRSPSTRIERIISKGHTSPESGWYDQDENEWVIVLQGAAKLEFADRGEVSLSPGDYINIPAHQQHRVSWSDPEQTTIWLAIFYP